MGIADRDYHRMPSNSQYGGMPRQPSRLAGCPVVKWLLILNIAIFFLDMVIFKESLANWGYFSVENSIYGGQIWRILTFQFLHANGMHLFGNMLGLFFFGHFAEKWWGSGKFLVFYFTCGIAGALFYTLLFWIPGLLPSGMADDGMVGASAGIYGILIAVAVIAPNLKVLLYFVIPMSIRTMAIAALAIAAYVALTNGDNAGGEAAHLGGAILGFILMKNPVLLAFVSEKPIGGKTSRTIDAKVVRQNKVRPRIEINLNDSEIDRILDKVSRDGIQSLTTEEKNVLRRTAGQ